MGAQHQTPPQLLHHHVLESHAAVLPHSTSAHQHITLALLPSCAIIPGTMRSGTAHVHVLSALYSTTWHVHLPLAPSLLPTACILALCCIYLLQTHTVRREGSRPRIIAMRFALQSQWRPVATEPTGNEGHTHTDTQGRGTHTGLDDSGACNRSRGWRRPRLYLPGQSGAFQRWGVRTTHLVLHHFLTAGKGVGAAASWGGGDNECAWTVFFSPPTSQRARPEGRKTASCG